MGAVQRLLLPLGSGVSGIHFDPAATSAEITLSASNSVATRSATNNNNWRTTRSLTSHNSGKYYAECVNNTNGAFNGSMMFGVATAATPLTNFTGETAGSYGVHANNSGGARTYNNNTATNVSFTPFLAPGGVAHVAIDYAAGRIWLGLNGVYPASGNPAAGTNPTYTFVAGTALLLSLSEYSASQQCTLKNNVGENSLAIPAGFSMYG